MCLKMYNDDWCIAEEKKYMGESLEIYMTSGIETLYEKLVKDIKRLMDNPYYTADYHRALNDVLAVIDKRFGKR